VPEQVRWGIPSTANIVVKRFIPGASRSRNGVVAGTLRIPGAYGSYDELLQDPDIDAIYNPLSNRLHAELTVKAAAAGKPILCEKPLALSSEQVRLMVDACRTKGVLLMEAFMYRFHPEHRRVQAKRRRLGREDSNLRLPDPESGATAWP
jgi:xylose dehydrogenase (NAD/NADP)